MTADKQQTDHHGCADAGPSFPITKSIVMKLCVDQGFYRTPSCNDKLYLHFKGFDAISGLEEYTEVKVLWLESNAIRTIEGLDTLVELRQLYLHQNLISRIEGLSSLTKLDTLNLSDNSISCVSGLSAQCDSLTVLQLKNNRIEGVDALEHLLVLRHLASLDLSGNKIDDGEGLLTLLSQLPSLKSLHLTGNPCVRKIPNYRKTVLSRLPDLLHLDEKPVFADERRLVAAWVRGGVDAERQEKKSMRDEEIAAINQRLADFRNLQQRAQQGMVDDTDSDPSGSDAGAGEEDVWVPPSSDTANQRSDSQISAVPSVSAASSTTSSFSQRHTS